MIMGTSRLATNKEAVRLQVENGRIAKGADGARRAHPTHAARNWR
jgi:hypothetical protein